MTRISYLNGKFLPHNQCLIHIEDRGFQFGDGVYEVTLFKNGELIDGDLHLQRLLRSLEKMKINHDLEEEELLQIELELFRQNNLDEGTCYLNVTRGNHTRVQNFPKDIHPTINITVAPRKKISPEEFNRGFSVITHEDIRWHRCDIKTNLLLPSSMINQKAKDLGFNDAIFIRDNFITEASFSNVFIVDQNDKLITRDADNFILCGVTRNRLIDLAKSYNIRVEERKFTKEELFEAKEVFLTSSSLLIRPVVKIDDVIISDSPGEITRLLLDSYLKFFQI